MKLFRLKKNFLKVFMEGFSKVLDITGSSSKSEPLKIRPFPVKSDREALAQDWQAVGGDLWRAFGKIKKSV